MTVKNWWRCLGNGAGMEVVGMAVDSGHGLSSQSIRRNLCALKMEGGVFKNKQLECGSHVCASFLKVLSSMRLLNSKHSSQVC